MERYIGRECGRYSGGFETWIVSISKGTVRIFHEEMISDRALANFDRPVEKLGASAFSPCLHYNLRLFRTAGVQNSRIV
jgi:hypothetical protein